MRARLVILIVSLLFLPWWLLSGSVGAEATASDNSIRLYQRMLQRKPRDARTYYRLGDAYIQKARETGDVTYFNLAEQALRKSLEIAPDYSGALRHLAYVLYSRHEFKQAAVEAARAIELDPTDSHAYGILGDAYLEIGKYDEAGKTFQKMVQLRGDLYSYSRISGLKSLRGDTKGAIEDLERAIQSGKAYGRPQENTAWAQWQLGSEQSAIGNLKEAESQHIEALKTYPNYYRALAGLAHVRAAQGRYLEAIDLYRKAIAIIPLPEYAASLGDIYTKVGRAEDAKKQYDLVEYIGYLNTLNKVLYNRELAYFYADHDIKLPQSMELAEKELEVREDIYAYDLLAWALYKNGRLQEARDAMRKALALGTKDARLFFHAGMIERGLGNAADAGTYLRQALSLNPHFHPLHADITRRTLAELGPEKNAKR